MERDDVVAVAALALSNTRLTLATFLAILPTLIGVVSVVAFGIGVGWLSLRLRKWARDQQVEGRDRLGPVAAAVVQQDPGAVTDAG